MFKQSKRFLICATGATLLLGILHGQPPQRRQSLSEDWTDQQVVFTETKDIWKMLRNQQDPRYVRRRLRDLIRERAQRRRGDKDPRLDTKASVRDWNTSLGTGANTMSVGQMPAKFVFDVDQPASCTNDFLVTGTGLAGSATQASVVAYRNLYTNPSGTGSCPGTGPTVMWAYNLNGATVRHAAVLSLDGTKVVLVDSSGAFHVLKWSAAAGNGTAVNAPAVPGTGNTATVTTIPLSVGLTSPFIDYTADVAYVTTGNGLLRKIMNVFNGTPTEATTGGWPVTIPRTNLSTPVFDFVSKKVFLTADGTIYQVDTTQANVSVSATNYAFATAAASYPVIVDSTNQKIYGWNPSNGSNAVIAQADTALSAGSRVLATVGATASNSPLGGDFNNAYYTGNAANARLYVVGNTGTGTGSNNRTPALYMFSFDAAFKLNPTRSGGPLALAVGTAEASYVTGFYNSTQNRDYMFVGVTNNCQSTGITGGCIRSLNVSNSSFPTTGTVNSVILGATGGTYGIAIDNNSSAAEASSVYYVTRGSNLLVKATQAALN